MATYEWPILCGDGMVRAILSGKKTQTRCVMRPQPIASVREVEFIGSRSPDGTVHKWDWMSLGQGYESQFWQCPYGQPGDRLWVREAWADSAQAGADEPGIVYRATDPCWSDYEGWRWRPSIHMPREASRLTLDVVDVRTERVLDISEEDCIAEGVIPPPDYPQQGFTLPGKPDEFYLSAQQAFGSVWDAIHGGFPGAVNPWVWVVVFQRRPESPAPSP